METVTIVCPVCGDSADGIVTQEIKIGLIQVNYQVLCEECIAEDAILTEVDEW